MTALCYVKSHPSYMRTPFVRCVANMCKAVPPRVNLCVSRNNPASAHIRWTFWQISKVVKCILSIKITCYRLTSCPQRNCQVSTYTTTMICDVVIMMGVDMLRSNPHYKGSMMWKAEERRTNSHPIRNLVWWSFQNEKT